LLDFDAALNAPLILVAILLIEALNELAFAEADLIAAFN
jgi:hypothetical protein